MTESKGEPLTKEIVRDGLRVLGKNPYTLALVYTTASLCERGLSDIDTIGSFPHLQHIECSRNQLTSLAPLRDLKLLLSVDASHNQLMEALDFDIPQCTPENAWVGGGEWIGSLLRRAVLSYNRITKIRDLGAAHPFLQELHLAHNEIKEIQGISSLRFLRVLDLSHNRFTSTQGLVPKRVLDGGDRDAEVPTLEALEELRLNHNQISNIDEVVVLPRLTVLDVSHNKLKSLSCLEHCYRLQRLNVSHNDIVSMNELNYLIPLPFFQQLELVGCPVRNQEDSPVFYRARVLRRLQQLIELDGDEISAKDKMKALTMHGSEVASRKEVLAKFLPSEDFVNYLPQLDYEEDAELRTFLMDRFQFRPETEGVN